MEEMSKHGEIGRAAMKADMDRKTARKYADSAQLPSEMLQPRTWRTRQDPFAGYWEEFQSLLEQTPYLRKARCWVLCGTVEK